jgi:hypothetical protein
MVLSLVVRESESHPGQLERAFRILPIKNLVSNKDKENISRHNEGIFL